MEEHLLTIISKCGVPCKGLAPLHKKTKLGTKTMDCIFIGYVLNSSAYRFLVYKSEIPDIHVNMIIEFRDVVFFEYIFSYKREEDNTFGKRIHEMVFRNESSNKAIVNAEVKQRRSQISRISKSFGPYFIAYAIESAPQTFKKVMSTPKAQI